MFSLAFRIWVLFQFEVFCELVSGLTSFDWV